MLPICTKILTQPRLGGKLVGRLDGGMVERRKDP